MPVLGVASSLFGHLPADAADAADAQLTQLTQLDAADAADATADTADAADAVGPGGTRWDQVKQSYSHCPSRVNKISQIAWYGGQSGPCVSSRADLFAISHPPSKQAGAKGGTGARRPRHLPQAIDPPRPHNPVFVSGS